MYNNNSNSGEWAVITNQLRRNKLSDLATTETPMDTIRSIKSESDLQKPNSTKSELLEDIPCAKTRRSDEYELSARDLEDSMTKTPTHTFRSILSEPECESEFDLQKPNSTKSELLEENSHSDLKKSIKSDSINYDGLSYLGVFLLQRKMNCVDEDTYPGLAEVDDFIRKNNSFPKTKDFVDRLGILSTCPVDDEKHLFDLNLFPPARVRSYRRANCKDETVIFLAKAALDDFNKSASNPLTYKFTKVVKAVAQQMTYYITFRAKDGTGNKKIFQTKVAAYSPKVTVFYVREKL